MVAIKIAAIIQARVGSTRLPGKVLMKLGEKSVLSHVVDRIGLVPAIQQTIVATTTLSQDDSIVKEAEYIGASVYRGSETDVLSRYYQAAVEHDVQVIVRITSDCPFIDPDIVGQLIDGFKALHVDYISNTNERTFPRGLDAEVFSIHALKEAHDKALYQEQREHVTPYIYQNPQTFTLQGLKNDIDYSHYRWTLDTVEDWQFIREVYDRLGENQQHFRWNDILNVLERFPHLVEINSHVEQKRLTSQE